MPPLRFCPSSAALLQSQSPLQLWCGSALPQTLNIFTPNRLKFLSEHRVKGKRLTLLADKSCQNPIISLDVRQCTAIKHLYLQISKLIL